MMFMFPRRSDFIYELQRFDNVLELENTHKEVHPVDFLTCRSSSCVFSMRFPLVTKDSSPARQITLFTSSGSVIAIYILINAYRRLNHRHADYTLVSLAIGM